jgi:hypothetical protein
MALDVRKWAALGSRHFIPGKYDFAHWVGSWVGPTIDLDIADKIRFFATAWNQNFIPT